MNTSTVYIRGVPLYICIPYLLLFFFSSCLPSLLVSLHCQCLSLSLSPAAPAQLAQQPEDLPEGMYRCEFCGHVEHKAKFLAPSRRFCSLTCCKRLGDLSLSSLFFLSVSCPFASPSFPPSLYFPCPLLCLLLIGEQSKQVGLFV